MRAIKNLHTVLVEIAHLISKDVHEGLEACGFSPLGVWRNDARLVRILGSQKLPRSWLPKK